MIGFRKTLATASLAVFAGLILVLVPAASDFGSRGLALVLWLALIPLTASGIGLWLDTPWARWSGLGIGLAVLPWATVWIAGAGLDEAAPVLALAASVILLISLSGRRMSRRFSAFGDVLSAGRRRLLDWTIACNIAAALVLLLFVGAYDYGGAAPQLLSASLMVCLIAGVGILGAGRTAGLLVVGACALLLLPAVGLFVAEEASSRGEALLLGAAFLPGIATALASLAAFGGPMWRVVRGRGPGDAGPTP